MDYFKECPNCHNRVLKDLDVCNYCQYSFKGFNMKKFIVLLILAMGSWLQAADVSIVKSKFTPNEWTIYIPADDAYYYSAIRLGTPYADDAYLPNFTILSMAYGKIRNGHRASAYDYATESTLSVTGSWSQTADRGDGDWYTIKSASGTLTYNVPANHNEIHVTILRAPALANNVITFAWSDDSTTGLLKTDLTGMDTGVSDVVVTTTADGSKDLKITSSSASAEIIGITSYDTDSIGDIASDADDGLAYYIGDYGNGYSLGQIAIANSADTSLVALADLANPARAYEFAVQWCPAGGTPDWTGGNTHYLSTDSEYVMGAEYTSGPELVVDGVSKSYTYDNTTNPRGQIYSGDRIVIQSTGYINQSTAINPNMSFVYLAEPTGLTVVGSIIWNEAVEFSVAYTPMMMMSTSFDTDGYFSFLDGTKTAVSTIENQTITGKGNVCKIFSESKDIEVTLTSFSPIASWFYVEADNKFYGKIDDSILGGATPAAGDMLVLGGRWSINRYWTLDADEIKKDVTTKINGVTVTGEYNPAKGWLAH